MNICENQGKLAESVLLGSRFQWLRTVCSSRIAGSSRIACPISSAGSSCIAGSSVCHISSHCCIGCASSSGSNISIVHELVALASTSKPMKINVNLSQIRTATCDDAHGIVGSIALRATPSQRNY